jgi:beta-N-acetylhexosaminidase
MARPASERTPPGSPRARRRAAARERRRRRRTLIAVAAAAAALALAAGLIAGAGAGDDGEPAPDEPASDPVAGLGTSELAGQRLVAGFAGADPPPGLLRMLAAGELAGVILFEENIAGRGATARMTSRLQAAAARGPVAAPLLVMTDQEGGGVERFDGPPAAAAAAMGERGAAFARRQGARTAAALRARGINVDLAPVLDLARPGGALAAEERTFGSTADEVIAVGVGGFAAGLRAGGVAATAKHFPGLGGAGTNTDLAAQRIDLGAAALRAADEAPFAAFADAGGELVMLALATYPALAPEPAALAPEVATGELRDRLGFDGVSITDSLDAAAARAWGGRGEVARAAAAAGADLLLYGDWRTAADVHRDLVAALRRGRLDRAGFERSAARVTALRAGLEPAPDGG